MKFGSGSGMLENEYSPFLAQEYVYGGGHWGVAKTAKPQQNATKTAKPCLKIAENRNRNEFFQLRHFNC